MSKYSQIERWYSGKALKVIQDYVLPTLAQAEANGYWPKGASRKVKAALNKQTVAAKFARANDRDWNLREKNPSGRLVDITSERDGDRTRAVRGWDVMHAMMFGLFENATKCLTTVWQLGQYSVNDAELEALKTAQDWAVDFKPVAELVKLLDSRRPRPVVVCKTLSPTVLRNVGGAMGVSLDSIQFPEIVWKWVTMLAKDGTEYQISVGEIKWPAGTRHNTSRFAAGTAHNEQCHACGHAIKRSDNWVPLLAQTPSGPASLWVGRDCASKLFGCEVAGEADWSVARKGGKS